MYDFKSLSSHDFELLVRDLLQKKLNIFLESFKDGRDGGIDLRHAPAKDTSLIVQCKHYANTGFPGLLTSLKKEKLKVKKLSPNRYIIATSVSLTPHNKKQIAEIFGNCCKETTDIFGADELNNLISQYPEIERQHFKLWLTSTAILEKIINNGLYNQTQILVEAIQKKISLYVQNDSFYDALSLLKEHRFCIISGIPGIGKTFLAEILLLQYISNGYQPVVIRNNISEAFEMLKASTKQVFYYDDFLGQTGWEEKLEKNEEQSILDFIKYVKDSKHASFILTTREYILQRARNVYEKLHAPEFEYAKCIIKIESYTRRNKAHILFNHIYFSNLSLEHKRSLCQKEILLKIVDHKNYSPRIVEWMSNQQNIKDFNSTEYPEYFLSTLSNPSELWRHAFRNHLAPPSRSLLLVLMTFRFGVDLNDLKEAFSSYRAREVALYGGAIGPADFIAALDELEGSFIRCEREGENIGITFHNPSVLDFLEKFLGENAEQLHLLCSSMVFYDQFLALCSLRGGKKEHDHIAALLKNDTDLLIRKILECVEKTAKQKRFHKKDDNTFVCTNAVQTTVEENIANAVRISSHLPSEHQQNTLRRLLEIEISRLASGKKKSR